MKYLPHLVVVVALPIVLVTYIIALGYTPLSSALITLPNETEILLFSVQAGVGAATIGHFFGSRKGEKSKKTIACEGVKQGQRINLMYLVLIIAVVAIFVLPFVINSGGTFSGTDGQGPDAISSSGYTPWIQPMGITPDALGERVLFSLQVAIGASILGYLIGYIRAKSPL